MSPAEFSQWVSGLDLFTSLRESALAYPVIMSLHLSSIAVFGGLILMTDLRLLGLAMPNMTVSDIIAQTRIWKRIGFVVMVMHMFRIVAMPMVMVMFVLVTQQVGA